MPEFSDLLRRAQGGERDALSTLYDTFHDCVERTARAGLGPSLRPQFDATDISQSVFGDLLREIGRVEDRGEVAFRGWLVTKVQNKLRTKARRQVLVGGIRREARLTTEVGSSLACAEPPPDADAAARDDAAHLTRILGTLEPDQRTVVGLHVDEGLPWVEVARRAGLPTADAARMRYVRALAALRDRWTRA